MQFEKAILSFRGQPITQQILMHLLKDFKWPHNKIAQLVEQNYLTPIKRGIYITGPELNLAKPSNFLLANHIYGPSYISLESALSYWGLIPEKVAAIISVTTGATKTFRTPVGQFRFIHTGLPYYCFGIEQVMISTNQTVLMASKEKALCDKIVMTAGVLLRSMEQTMDFLTEDLRIELEVLSKMDIETIRSWIGNAPKKRSLGMLVKSLERL